MFIEINGTYYNVYSISSFNKSIQSVVDQSGSVIVKYLVNYVLNNSDVIVEKFDDQATQEARYEYMIEKFGVETTQNNQ